MVLGRELDRPVRWSNLAQFFLFGVIGFVLNTEGARILSAQDFCPESQVTSAPHGHMLTNIGVWSPDAQWIVYDTRQSLDGSVFNGQTIERIQVATGRVERLYESSHGAHCGVVTYHPFRDQVIFILGPEHPEADWQYGPTHRQGVLVNCDSPNHAVNLDARDLVPEFTPGALRGGTHVHTFSPDGKLVASTYEDAFLEMRQQAESGSSTSEFERNLRGVAISLLNQPVRASHSHRRNHDGASFTVLGSLLTDHPAPGSDQIMKACEEGWLGRSGYLRADGSRQEYALAFLGTVVGKHEQPVVEVFVLDLPSPVELLRTSGSHPLAGTRSTRPQPPALVRQRRVTFTENRRFPGVASQPRHWLRSSPDGSKIAFLAKVDDGTVQLHTVDPEGKTISQLTSDHFSVSSAFSFSPDGKLLAYVADNSIFVCDADTGHSKRLTPANSIQPPRPEACVFSPNGRQIAFMRTVEMAGRSHNQIFVIELKT